MHKYNHLTIEEREKIFLWLDQKLSKREIARRIGRNVSTITREIKRNTKYGKKYYPSKAQKRYTRISKKQRIKSRLKNTETILYVREHLRDPYRWSPETISERLKLETNGRLTISVECIYQYIYSKHGKKGNYSQYLACKRTKRKKMKGRSVRRKGKAINAVSIEKRPKYIQKRKQVGHWETDDMCGPKGSKPALSVTRERVTRYTRITKMKDQTKSSKTNAVISELKDYPKQIRRTITQDNGTENYGHEDTARVLGTKMYFCHAYSSYEKGGVERAIKDIRILIPKGTPLNNISKEQVQYIEDWLNHKPMKCLGWRTPHEKMQQVLSKIKST